MVDDVNVPSSRERTFLPSFWGQTSEGWEKGTFTLERYVHVPACCGRAPRRYGCRARPLPGRRQLAGLLSGSPSARRDPSSPQKSRPGPEKDGSHALLTPPSLHLRTAESRWSPLCLRPTSTLNSAQEPPFLHHAAPPLGISHLGGRARAAPRPMGRGAVPLRGPGPRALSGLLGRGHRSRRGTGPISTRNSTDLGAEPDRSRCGSEPISARGPTGRRPEWVGSARPSRAPGRCSRRRGR